MQVTKVVIIKINIMLYLRKKNSKSIEKYLNDIEFVKEAIKANPEYIDFIPNEIKKDNSVALECVL